MAQSTRKDISPARGATQVGQPGASPARGATQVGQPGARWASELEMSPYTPNGGRFRWRASTGARTIVQRLRHDLKRIGRRDVGSQPADDVAPKGALQRMVGYKGRHSVRHRMWFPQAEPLVVPNANHMLPFMNPHAVSDGMAAFIAHHPL